MWVVIGKPHQSGSRKARIVLATTGSLGEVYPFVALAAALQARGHACTIATSDVFRRDIEAAGVAFKRMRPDLRDDPEFVAKLFNPAKGGKFWFREVQMPVIEEAYQDVLALMRDADLLISRSLAYAAPIVAEVTGAPWITTKLSPTECMSAYDPPYIHTGRWIARLIRHSPGASDWTMRRFRQVVRALNFSALKNLRRKLQLPPSNHYEYWGPVRPRLDLRMFSPLMGKPQPDWPAYARQTGFVTLDDAGVSPPLSAELEAFLLSGPPPVAFSLGSQQFAERNQNFLRVSFEAIQRLGRRAVLLTGGRANRKILPEKLPPGIFAIDQAPHGALFARAAVIVHHCGIGTVARALRAGRPQFGVPFVFDQPDNSTRLSMLGVARAVHGTRYTVERATEALSRLLTDPAFEVQASKVAAEIAAERGLDKACAAIEEVLDASPYATLWPAPPLQTGQPA